MPTRQPYDWIDGGECVWLTTDPDFVTARERMRTLEQTIGFSEADQNAMTETMSELAARMLTDARAGEIWIEAVTTDEDSGLRVIARDWTPGRGLYFDKFFKTARASAI